MKERVGYREVERREGGRMGRGGRVRESKGVEGEERIGKGETGLDVDICPGAAEFVVTPLYLV